MILEYGREGGVRQAPLDGPVPVAVRRGPRGLPLQPQDPALEAPGGRARVPGLGWSWRQGLRRGAGLAAYGIQDVIVYYSLI